MLPFRSRNQLVNLDTLSVLWHKPITMKISKFLAATFIALGSCLLYSCSCEDVDLGTIERTGELDNFLPVANGETIKVMFDGKVGRMGYVLSRNNGIKTIPVKETGKTRVQGKGADYDCIEFYTAEEKVFLSYSNTSTLLFNIGVLLTKNISPQGFTEIVDKDHVDDVIEYSIGYYNIFPQAVTRGMQNHEAYYTYRSFTLSKKPADLIYKKNNFTQEHLASVTLNGVVHENVYHLYLTSPQYTEDEKYFNSYYPLTYVQGMYVKEGVGIVQAYTSTGQKIDFSLE